MIEDKDVSEIKDKVSTSFKMFEEDSQLRNLLTVLLYDEGKTRDTLDLFQLLPVEYFVKIIQALNGRRVRFIDSETLNQIFKTIILYVEIDQEKKSWEEVRRKYPEWKISKNNDKILIDKLINSLQEKVQGIF